MPPGSRGRWTTRSRPKSTACRSASASAAPSASRAARPSGGAERGLELLLEVLLGVGADDRLDRLSSLEEDHRRDRKDLEASRCLRGLVGVELDDPEVLTLCRDLLEHGGNDTARTTPGRPEVDEDGPLGLDDLG